jgi:hypothetical protein
MPWFKIDDSSHSHPKFMQAGNAALGLWVRCGAYSAQHLLEGMVPGFIAKSYGSTAQISKLVKVGLWHGAEHGCPRCPQPSEDGYVIHDFFEGGRNSTRAQVEASRQAAADRQAKARARAAERAAAEDADEKTPPKSEANRDAFEERLGSKSSQESEHSASQFSQSTAGQEGPSRRDAINGVTPSLPKPSRAGTSFGSTSASKQDRDSVSAHPSGDEQIPEWARPLQELMRTGGLGGLRWNLKGRWILLQQLMNQKGIEAMADHAIRAAGFASKPVVYVTYFLDGWKELSDQPPEGTAKPKLQTVKSTGHRPFQPPEDHSVYENGFHTHARTQASGE